MLDLLGLAMLIIIGTLLVWSGLRAWRTKSHFVKWGGTGVAALL